MAKPSLKSLQAHLSYRFRNCQLLLEALTHSSYAREASDRVRDNERMEFLGDAVLNFLVSVRLADTKIQDRITQEFHPFEVGILKACTTNVVPNTARITV